MAKEYARSLADLQDVIKDFEESWDSQLSLEESEDDCKELLVTRIGANEKVG